MNGAAYIMVVLGILLAKGIGFLRDMVFAWVFGATAYTDIYFQIFGLVNLIFTGIGVALSTLIIKNLNKSENSGEEKQRRYVSYFITRTTLIVAAVTCVLYAFARPATRLLLPGLDKGLYGTAVKLMYIMLPSFLFVIIAYIISGVLQNKRVFFITSIMSLPFNVIIIASLFVKNIDIITVGIVTTIGWFLHIAIQLPSFYKKGYRLFGAVTDEFRSKGGNSEALYIFISNMMFQVCFLIDKAFVSAENGAVTTINYASNLFITISSVFVVAMSNVVFPAISKNYEEGNIDYLRGLLQYIISIMFAIFLPFILTVICFGESIIRLVYEHGEFTPQHTRITALLFAIYTLGALGYVCQELFNKILYLDSRYACTVTGTLTVIGLKPLVNMFAVRHGGAVAVSAATTVLLTLYAVNVALTMKKVTGSYADRSLLSTLLRITLGGAAAAAVFALFKVFAPRLTGGRITFVIPLLCCGAAYLAALYLTGTIKYLLKKGAAERAENQ